MPSICRSALPMILSRQLMHPLQAEVQNHIYIHGTAQESCPVAVTFNLNRYRRLCGIFLGVNINTVIQEDNIKLINDKIGLKTII